MTSNLERYGVFALIFVVLLIVGISLWGPTDEGSARVASKTAQGEDTLAIGEETQSSSSSVEPGASSPVESSEPRAQEGQERDFDFDLSPASSPSAGAADGGAPSTGSPLDSRDGEWVVKPGDNPSKIASKVYGDDRYVRMILDANPKLDARRMMPGDRVRLPKLDAEMQARYGAGASSAGASSAARSVTPVVSRPAASERPARRVAASPAPPSSRGRGLVLRSDGGALASAAPTFHTVRKGESLETIALRYYKDRSRAAEILRANPQVKNPNFIREGWKLRIP